jgi:hypothetical protein
MTKKRRDHLRLPVTRKQYIYRHQMPSVGVTTSPGSTDLSRSSHEMHFFLFYDDEQSETRCDIPEDNDATLEKWLEGLLPNDNQCIPLCQTFRQNLPRIKLGKQFPVRLEIISPVFHPGHKLVGTNHQALADCQQTRYVSDCQLDSIKYRIHHPCAVRV